MAKVKPGPKPDPNRRMTEVIKFRARKAYAAYLRTRAKEEGVDVAAILEDAVECQAKRKGWPEPPARQV
jgi:hypothetical protein